MTPNLTIIKEVFTQRRDPEPSKIEVPIFEAIYDEVGEALRTSDITSRDEKVDWVLNSINSMGETIMQVHQSSSVDETTYTNIISDISNSLTDPKQQLDATIRTIQDSLKTLTTRHDLIKDVLNSTIKIYQAAKHLYGKSEPPPESLTMPEIMGLIHNTIQTYPVTFYAILALGFINQINHAALRQTVLNAFLNAVKPYIQQELANTQTHPEPSHAQENYEELLEKLGISIEPIDSVYTPEASYKRQNTIQIRFPKGCAKKCKKSIREDFKSISHALLKQLREQSLGSHPLASLPKALTKIAKAKGGNQITTQVEDLIGKFSDFTFQRVIGGPNTNAIDNISQITVKPITEQQDDRHTVTGVVLEIYGNNKGLKVVIRKAEQQDKRV